jgi:hypothetical protein
MAPLANASFKKALVAMPKELNFFMETADINGVRKACTYVAALSSIQDYCDLL